MSNSLLSSYCVAHVLKVTSIVLLLVIFGGLFSFIGIQVGLRKLPLAANESEVSDSDFEHTLLLSSPPFRSPGLSSAQCKNEAI